ncbi:MAG: multifunctional CCA addition/repair protein [Methylotetracoccus sp.]
MRCYLVGGAVRDQLLGRPVVERDWVVIGESPASMAKRGFKAVGRDFPVFLHPETHEEYALARTERKTAPGYRGFEVAAGPDISLEDDLLRRDLTINAMALDAEGRLIDPYGGRADLQQRRLRHVSPAFREDPVRILRVARFAARYAELGFLVADETLDLMRAMVDDGEVDALVPERIWAELERALGESVPGAFLAVLRACGALARLLPEVDRLFGVPQPAEHHPEIDTGAHVLLALEQAVLLGADRRARFAVLTHDLGKGLTPSDELPSHHGHEQRGLEPLRTLCERFKVPNAYRTLAEQVMLFHGCCHRALELRPATVVDLLQRLDVLHRRNEIEAFVLACEADARGRTGLERRPYPQAAWLRAARQAALDVPTEPLVRQGLRGEAFGAELRRRRIDAVRAARPLFDAAMR